MGKWQLTLIITGRTLISLFFIFSAVNKILDWTESERALTNVFCDWQAYTASSVFWQQFFSFFMQWAWAVLAGLIVLELLAGIFLLCGYKVKAAASFLILFMLCMTVLLHHFWFLSGEKRDLQLMFFFKNIAILGALFYVSSVDTKKAASGFGGMSLSKLSDPFK
ncbi:MAG: DoxX family protein [Parachlamydiales bacterium]|jgi:uncharacterized membrane protein YphA (DoxX/SURF4 family)